MRTGCGINWGQVHYELPRRTGEAHFYRLTHPLGEAVVSRAKVRQLEPAEVIFDYNAYEGTVAILKPYVGQSGWIVCTQLSVEALDTSEDHLLLVGRQDSAHGGVDLPPAVIARMLSLPAKSGASWSSADEIESDAQQQLNKAQATIQGEISERNAAFFSTEADKLDGWADDLKVGLEREIKEVDRLIKEARRAATTALSLEQKLDMQKKIKALEATRNTKRRNLFDAQDEIEKQRADLIAKIEGKLEQRVEVSKLFSIRWRVQ